MGVHAIGLGVLDLAELESIPLLYGMTLLLGLLTAFDNPTRRTLSTELVAKGQLANVLALSTSVMTGSRIFGPAIGALLAGAVGTAWVFLLNGATFLIFILAMRSMDPNRFHPLARGRRSATPVRDGLREVWVDPVLRITIVAFTTVPEIKLRRLRVATFQAPAGEIAQQSWPLVVGVAHDDAVGVGLGIVGNQGDVRTAENHRNPSPAEPRGELVRPRSVSRDHRHAHQIGTQPRIDLLDSLVDADDLRIDLVGNQGRQGRKRQRHVTEGLLEDAASPTVEGGLWG